MRYIEKSDTPPKCLTDYISECDTLGVPRPFIAEEHCSTFFRYTINGEIIPNGEYGRWDDYLNNILPEGDVTDAFECIKILNLNCSTLVSERKQYVDILLKYLVSHTKEDVQEKVTEWNKGETYPSYITMLTQYITRRYPDIAI